jgi:hypothetical protein
MERARFSARPYNDGRMRKWGWTGVLALSGWKEAEYIVVRIVDGPVDYEHFVTFWESDITDRALAQSFGS